jgi:hypothetical protein
VRKEKTDPGNIFPDLRKLLSITAALYEIAQSGDGHVVEAEYLRFSSVSVDRIDHQVE